jgi:uncharacterized protein YndB with AHSA1/START domain
MKQEIAHTYFFRQSPGEVWEYLTRSELIEQWLMKTDFQPVVGHQFRFACNNITDCEVLEVIPNKLLSYSWKVKNENEETTVDSKVTWTLSEVEGGTKLHLQHGGFTLLEDTLSHNSGWITCLKLFEELLKAN